MEIDVVDVERSNLHTTIKAYLTQEYELLSMVFVDRHIGTDGYVYTMFTLVFKKEDKS